MDTDCSGVAATDFPTTVAATRHPAMPFRSPGGVTRLPGSRPDTTMRAWDCPRRDRLQRRCPWHLRPEDMHAFPVMPGAASSGLRGGKNATLPIGTIAQALIIMTVTIPAA